MLFFLSIFGFLSNQNVAIGFSSLLAYTTPETINLLTDFGVILGTVISLFLIAGFLEKRQKATFNQMMQISNVESEKKIAEETAKLIAKDLSSELVPIKGALEDTDHRLSRLETSFDMFLLGRNSRKSLDRED